MPLEWSLIWTTAITGLMLYVKLNGQFPNVVIIWYTSLSCTVAYGGICRWLDSSARIWLALIILLVRMSASNESVQRRKKVFVLSMASLPFLDLCYQLCKFAVIPSYGHHVLSNLFLSAQIRVCIGSCFEIGNADALAAILL